jgi:hypothetical protein
MEIILDIIRWLVAVAAGLLFTLCVLGNWSLIIGALLGHLKRFSLVLPFLGPLFGIVFFVAVPIDGAASFWWLATLVEPTWLLGAWCLVTWPFTIRKQTPPPESLTAPDRPRN